MAYLPFIDGLRAVAIAGVIIYHAMPHALPGGFAGVDVFFVISGFLITRFILEEMRSDTFSLRQFFIRRVRRLFPAAAVCFFVVTVISAFVLLPDAYWYFGRSLLAAVLMFANIFFYNTGGYFNAPALEKPLLHTWSLSVEDQFYLTWPIILLVLVWRFRQRAIFSIALTMLVVSLVYSEITLARNSEAAFFLLPSRAWELLTGVLIALGAHRVKLNATLSNGMALAGAAAIISSFALLSGEGHFPGLGAVPACAGTALVIIASLGQSTMLSRLLATRHFVFVGQISYSLYLWHWPLISLLSYRLERQLHATEAVVVIALSFVVSVLSWKFVEQPFRQRHQHHLSKNFAASDNLFMLQSFAALLGIVGIAAFIKAGKGLPQRYDAEVRAVLEQMVSGNPVRGSCDNYHNVFRNEEVCSLGRKRLPGQSYEVALFGDSMADHWTPLVAKYANEENLTFRQVTNGGCGLFFGIDIPARPAAKANECRDYQRAARRFIDANPGLKIAVVSGYWEKWLARIEFPEWGEDAAPLYASETPKFDAVLKQTLEVFTSKGIHVMLIGQIPVYARLPVRCIVTNVRQVKDAGVCGLTREEAEAQARLSNAALERAAVSDPLVSVSLPTQFMCQKKMCSPILQSILLYKNADHVNRYGAVALSQFVEFPKLDR